MNWIEDRTRIYERAEVQQALGETLRPGGLALTKRALEYCDLLPGARVLDAGCGAGLTVQYLRKAGYLACGIDLSLALLGKGRQQYLDVALADAVHLPLPAGRMEAIFCECSLSVFAQADDALREFYRLLNRSGYLVISDLYARNPAHLAALRALPAGSCIRGMMSQADLLARLAAYGLELLIWEDHSEALRHISCQTLAMPNLSALDQGETGGCGLDALDLQLAIAKARPGYFLLIAQKH